MQGSLETMCPITGLETGTRPISGVGSFGESAVGTAAMASMVAVGAPAQLTLPICREICVYSAYPPPPAEGVA